jgi:multidrug transporter EmrE-like cation transporter
MSIRGLVLLLITCFCTVSGNLLLRSGLIRAGGFGVASGSLFSQLLKLAMEPRFVSGFCLYGISALVWFAVISVEDLSTCYPVLASLTFVLVTLGAIVFFGERMSIPKLIGIAVILAGVIIVSRS